jgi:cytoskeletal protein CcmA (bactofilin family)
MSYTGVASVAANQQSFSLGKGIKVRGEISGAENLHYDGELEGSINLSGNTLVIGPNAKMKADVTAKQIVVHGRVEGNMTALELLDIRSTASVAGELIATRLNIEDGAVIKGTINIRRDGQAVAPAQTAQSAQAVSLSVPEPERTPAEGQLTIGSQTPVSIPVTVKPNI